MLARRRAREHAIPRRDRHLQLHADFIRRRLEQSHTAVRAGVGLAGEDREPGVVALDANTRGRLQPQRFVKHLARGPEILLHEQRRERERVGHVVEAVAGVVRRKLVGGAGLDAEDVANGVVVFRAVQAAQRDVAGVGPLRVHVEYRAINPIKQEPALRGRGLRLLHRGHDMTLQKLCRLLPCRLVTQQPLEALVSIESELALAHPAAVAVEAELAQHG